MSTTFYTRISLPEDSIGALVNNLNENLAKTISATLASKYAHWNVKGAGFHPTHKLFDEIYEYLADAGDTIAERLASLGGVAEGRLDKIQGLSYDVPPDAAVEAHVKGMADLVAEVANSYRAGMFVAGEQKDLATQDVYIELARGLDKFLYFLEATLRA